MANITLRSGLNRPLTVEELDNNFIHINDDLLKKSPIISPTFTGIVTAPTFTSTVATGTAPFIVTSTTVVANLSVGGNAATVTTNANLTGMVTSIGNAATVVRNANLTGMVTSIGNAATVVTNANLTGMVTSIGNAASLGSFSSNQLLNALTDETGTGANVFATNPTLVTPILGTPQSGNLTNCSFPTLNQNTTGKAATLDGTWNQMPAGTRVPFAQAAAPTGWTQDVTDNATNRMLRVVNTAGNGVGGSASPILNNTVPSHTHIFTGTALAAHTHTDAGHVHSDPGHQVIRGSPGGTTSFQDWTGSHNTGTGHAVISSNSAGTPAGTNAVNASAANWAPRYIDMIICAKN